MGSEKKTNILSKYIIKNITKNKILNKEDMGNYNIKKFNETIKQSKKSVFYAKKLRDINEIQKIEDIEKLPFTEEEEIRENYKKMLCISIGEVERIVHINTSGSTGESKTIFFSKEDLEYTINFFSYGLSQMVTKDDRMLILMPFKNENSIGDLVAKSMSRLGVITEKYGLIEDFDHAIKSLEVSDSIVGAPIQIQALARYSKFKKKNKKLKGVLTSSDYISKKTVDEIEDTFQCKVYNHYGLTETAYGGAVECGYHLGMHPRENDIYIEIIDPFTNKRLEDGEYGEIVLTTFNREAMPLIRYKTGDKGRFLKKKCVCNSSLKCLDYIGGRIQREKDRFNIYKMDEVIFENKYIIDYKFEVVEKEIKMSIITFLKERVDGNKIEKIIKESFNIDDLNISVSVLSLNEINYLEFHNGKRKIYGI